MVKRNASERGSALMLVTIIVMILVGISFAYMSISWWNQKKAFQDEQGLKALYIAESATAAYVNSLNRPTGSVPPAAVGKQFLAGGFWWVPEENLVSFGDTANVMPGNLPDAGYVSFQVAASVNGVVRRVNVMINRNSPSPNDDTMFSGNASGSPYEMTFASGDVVRGNIYSGGDVRADGTAQLVNVSGTAGNTTVHKGAVNSTLSGPNPPNFVQDTHDPLDLSPESNGKTRWENKAIANQNTTLHQDANGYKYIDVSHELTTNGTANHQWVDGSYGTDITSRDNPAHIFRMNPSSQAGSTINRTQRYEKTAPSAKNDFYLEDPTSTQVTQTSLNGSAHPVNGDTTASMVNIRDSGNNAVYFLDGNMRISGEPIKSYQLRPDGVTDPLRMTFVVKGNVSLTDNLLLPSWMSQTDGVAIIAIVDPAFPNTTPAQAAAAVGSSTNLTPNGVPLDTFVTQYNARAAASGVNMAPLSMPADAARAAQEYNKIYGSGNVFFGDPGSGTVEHFESFMYAQNNFYATNLDSTQASGGTQKLEVYGNMAAGEHIQINRNVSAGAGSYVPLNLTFNPLISAGGSMPDMPMPPNKPGSDWKIVSWKQSANTAETSLVK